MPINIHSIFAINAPSSEQMTQWLNYDASLTDKLQKITDDAQIELLSQCWVKTDWWASSLLQIADEAVFQRDIIMKSHGVPYWYARSIIPKTCYDLDPLFFDRLKQESIKNLIFNESRVRRIHRSIYPVDSQCMEFYWVQNNIQSVGDILWTRLTEFSFWEKNSFYLIELMLPELERLTS